MPSLVGLESQRLSHAPPSHGLVALGLMLAQGDGLGFSHTVVRRAPEFFCPLGLSEGQEMLYGRKMVCHTFCPCHTFGGQTQPWGQDSTQVFAMVITCLGCCSKWFVCVTPSMTELYPFASF